MIECLLEMIVGILGVLKVGGVYLLIDFDFLFECICYILSDLGISVLFYCGKLQDNIGCLWICIDFLEEYVCYEEGNDFVFFYQLI